MKSRHNDETMFLQKERQLIQTMEKELSYQYAAILLYNGGNGNSNGNKDQKEQFFFETLIYLISKVVKEFF